MVGLLSFLVAAALLGHVKMAAVATEEDDPVAALQETVAGLQQTLEAVSRQLMQQQFQVENSLRTDGQSGLKSLRGGVIPGSQPYVSSSYVDGSIANIHNHADNTRILGMAEVVAVLNGVEFRTRHNDYPIVQKSTTSGEYGAVEPIPFPEVPPEVLAKTSVDEQVEEMKEWFKAWSDQDHTVRDYRRYFKPVLCYLEAAWTVTNETIDEPFASERHFLDAVTWMQLNEKERYSAMTGHKNSLENLAFLPTTIYDIDANGNPVFAQWNYNILCHPLNNDLPVNRLRVVDDLKTRMKMRLKQGRDETLEDHEKTRAARFQLNIKDSDEWLEDAETQYTFLDELMHEIPGLNSYGSWLEDEAFEPAKHYVDASPLNAAYYHRLYRVGKSGAMGLKARTKGFADPALYMAMTTQSKVANIRVDDCRKFNCATLTGQWSYAVPLEIVYMTPISSWNPYNIEFRGDSDSEEAMAVELGPGGAARTGESHPDLAFNGTHSHTYYQTPISFFADQSQIKADTNKDYVWVLNKNGEPVQVTASGHRIMFPAIPGLDTEIRQRYPIMPIHQAGSAVWKELKAVADITLNPSLYSGMLPQHDSSDGGSATPAPAPSSSLGCPPPTEAMAANLAQDLLALAIDADMAAGIDRIVTFQMQPSTDGTAHEHYFSFTVAELKQMCQGSELYTVSTTSEGHQHTLVVKREYRELANGLLRILYLISKCDSEFFCSDGHERRVYIAE